MHEGLEGWEKRLLVERIRDLNSTHHNLWRLLAVKALAGVLALSYAA
jgi:hypothetical protein